jgi:predicted MPP superfamily phosphohydrolase
MDFVLLGLIVAAVIILWLILVDGNRFVVVHYQMSSPKIRKSFRCVVLADLHNKQFGRENQVLLDAIRAEKPDSILVAGDMLTAKSGEEYTTVKEFMETLAGSYPIYYANGNHEQRLKYHITGKHGSGKNSNGINSNGINKNGTKNNVTNGNGLHNNVTNGNKTNGNWLHNNGTNGNGTNGNWLHNNGTNSSVTNGNGTNRNGTNKNATNRNGTNGYIDESFMEEYYTPLEKVGVEFLENKHVSLGDTGISLFGLEMDHDFYRKKQYLLMNESYLSRVMGHPDPEEYVVLLAHNPEYFPQYEKWGADLVLSGHMHGGIVRVPIWGKGLISPSMKLFPKYDGGIYTQGNATMLISRGIGMHTVPVRLFNPGEIIVVDFEPS